MALHPVHRLGLRLRGALSRLTTVGARSPWIAPPPIRLAPTVRIARTATVETRCGGTIVIDDDSELLDYACVLSYGGHIRIGHNCSVNAFTVIYGHGGVTIGDNVLIAGHCMIIPSQHRFDRLDIPIRMQGATSRGIRIEDDVWIGHACSILDGVTIGRGAVVAAGSVVNRDVPPGAVVGGVPARVLKWRDGRVVSDEEAGLAT